MLIVGSRIKTPVERHIKQAGLMTKDIGQQASFEVPYKLVLTVLPAKSLQPTEAIIKRIEDQTQLMMDVKKYTLGSLC